MPPETRQILADINTIKDKLDRSNDTDPNFWSQELKELRIYIFQVHASHEMSIELIIYKDYLKSSKPFWDFLAMFERMTFEDKLRLVRKIHNDFPNRETVKLNELRNVFAHQKGETIRNAYNSPTKRLEAYQVLERAHDTLNAWFATRQAATSNQTT
jgi:hypothetical protein